MDEKASLYAVVSGHVQGVFFRAFVAEKATEFGLAGFVRNLPNGIEVEVKAEGEKSKLETLLVCLKTGPPGANVKKVNFRWEDFKGDMPSFRIAY